MAGADGDFELNGCQFAELALPASTVEDVFLQQGEERFHRCVVASCGDAAHRPGQLVGLQYSDGSSCAALGPTVPMNNDGSDR